MRRIVIAAAAGLALLAGSSVQVSASQSPAHLRGFSCQRAVRPVARSVSVTSVMRPVKGTKKLALRFELLTRTKAGTPWSDVSGGDLGSWLSPSNPTLGQRAGDVWILHKSVIDLAAPAAYRYKVSFRWTGAHQKTLATATRWTATCSQPELRPDLVVQSIDVQPISGKPNLNRYVATIANNGATAARSFRIEFAPGGGQQPKYHAVTVLHAHKTATTSFFGPACSTTAASTVTADPDGDVDDFNRANNTATADCSSSAGQP
jgi:CARDB protein